jgi:hypothetical protein
MGSSEKFPLTYRYSHMIVCKDGGRGGRMAESVGEVPAVSSLFQCKDCKESKEENYVGF